MFMFILLPLLLLLPTLSEQLDLMVDLPEGTIQGFPQVSRNGHEFAAFEGIPYAEKPTRFQPAVAKGGWEGSLDCTSPGDTCSQPAGPGITHLVPLAFPDGEYVGSEDCLYLNTYTAAVVDGGERDTNRHTKNLQKHPILQFLCPPWQNIIQSVESWDRCRRL